MHGNDKTVTLGVDWQMEQSVRYYKAKNNFTWLAIYVLNLPWASDLQKSNAQKFQCDLYYLVTYEHYSFINLPSKKVLCDYPATATVLYK